MRYLYLAFIFFFCFVSSVSALEPSSNKFGIHIAQPSTEDIDRAATLVNSNGGKWGYVTLVIQDNDRDTKKWQQTFDHMRDLRLVPIIRLATHPDGGSWKRATKEDVDQWVQFLNTLKWVVKDRYVMLFNEPNHAVEWGGSVDARNYGEVAKEFAKKLKASNKNYVLMLAGLDASAPSSSPNYEDEAVYLNQVLEVIPPNEFNELFDALSSHSYPNPAFAGSPNGSGKGTVRTYAWEVEYLKSLGVKELPVFITETGWDGTAVGFDRLPNYFTTVFENVWLPDDRVKAVTPFILNYPDEPFLKFSWIKNSEGEYRDHFFTVQALPKENGLPGINDTGVIEHNLPKELVVNSIYDFSIKLKNTGEGLWDSDEYFLSMDDSQYFTKLFGNVPDINPGAEGSIALYLKTGSKVGKEEIVVKLLRGDSLEHSKVVIEQPWKFETIPFPTLSFHVSFFPKVGVDTNDLELQVFDEAQHVVYLKKHVQIKDSKGLVPAVANVVPGRKYRVVVLRSGYLPRQKIVTFKKGKNEVGFKTMLPLDFDADGALTWKDIREVINKPTLLRRWIP